MVYQKIWDKIIAPGEEVKYEFSVGHKYRGTHRDARILLLTIIMGPFIIMQPLVAIGWAILCAIDIWYYNVVVPRSNAYAFTTKRVLIHQGWLSTRETSIDYDKITEITIDEPFWGRTLNKTGTITVRTAGDDEEIVFRHIENPNEVKRQLDIARG